MKHLTNLKDFKKSKGINETVFPVDDVYRVLPNIDVPRSLINAYIKKVKDETGRDIKDIYGQEQMAEMIVNYISSAYLNIENLPVTMAMGSEFDKGAQVQPTQQTQQQIQEPQQTQQGGQQVQQGGQQTQAQQTAQEIEPQQTQQGGQQIQQGGQQIQQGSQQIQQGGQQVKKKKKSQQQEI